MSDNILLQVLDINSVLPNRFQPRIRFENDSLEQLAESINKFGVIEPIVVRPVGNKYEIIAGERRYKASKLASKSTIPAVVVNLSDKDSEEIALLENVQRQNLNPIEEAVSYKRILDNGYISKEELAKKIGKPQTVIFNKIKLLSLADEVQSYLLNNKISERHARSLLNVNNLSDQVELLHRIVNERLTVKQTDKEIKKILEYNKDSSSTDEKIENLFDNESGDSSMDIDKIMREAKDINSFNTSQNESIPNLMSTSGGAIMPNDLNVERNNNESNNIENNKFVTVSPSESDISIPVQPIDTGVTFDSMFKAPLDSKLNDAISTDVNTTVSTSNNVVSKSSQHENSRKDISSIVADAFKKYDSEASFGQNNISNNYNEANLGGTPVSMPEMNKDNELSSNITNVPDMNIYGPDNNIDINQVPVSDSDSIISTTSSINNNNVSNFAQIVNIIRQCADNIEKLGHFVNIEEIDLDKQYKVTFTINK